jgi:hypothetical protein
LNVWAWGKLNCISGVGRPAIVLPDSSAWASWLGPLNGRRTVGATAIAIPRVRVGLTKHRPVVT